ncbi:MAG: hypothetical protein H7320_11695 [Ferruginibacter sp.]|nr:hypothetical protein [Ferruginibacter sp.]
MKNYIILLFALLLFAGCYTEKKATAAADKIARSFPEVLAASCKAKFPNTITKSDTIYRTDSVDVYVECPGDEESIGELMAEEYAGKQTVSIAADQRVDKPPSNTINNKPITTVKAKVPVRYITITNMVKDSANEVILQANATALTKKLRTQHNWLVFAFSLAGSFFILLLVLLYFFNRLLKRKKNELEKS